MTDSSFTGKEAGAVGDFAAGLGDVVGLPAANEHDVSGPALTAAPEWRLVLTIEAGVQAEAYFEDGTPEAINLAKVAGRRQRLLLPK